MSDMTREQILLRFDELVRKEISHYAAKLAGKVLAVVLKEAALSSPAPSGWQDSALMGRMLKYERSRCGCVLTFYERGVDQLSCPQHSVLPPVEP